MSVVVEYSVPASQFILGRALENAPALEIDLEQMVPIGRKVIPYFWLTDDNHEQFERALDREPGLSEYEVVDELDNRALYRVEWDSADDTFVQTLVAHDAILQQASGDAESWIFQLRFPDSDSLSAFHTACREAEIDVTVERLHHSAERPDATSLMTDAQQALVERAYDEGYFDIPRETTLADLADQVGLSDQAVNERLRRGLEALIEGTIKSPSSRGD